MTSSEELASSAAAGGGAASPSVRRHEPAKHPSPPARPLSQSRLHNFSFPTLNWGTQRLLRCANIGEPAPAAAARQPATSAKRAASGAEAQEEAAAAAARPWNLRTRRAACNAPDAGKAAAAAPAPAESWERRGGDERRPRRPEFALVLTKEEIEEDFMALKGSKPARRPKKRPRAIQKHLDLLFPGYYLSEATLDSYKIEE